MLCTSCGREVDPKEAFCTFCGTSVEDGDSRFSGPEGTVQGVASFAKRGLTQDEARVCAAYVKGGAMRKVGVSASILLLAFSGASIIGVVPYALELTVIAALTPVSLATSISARAQRRKVMKGAKTAYTIVVSGFPSLEMSWNMINVKIGSVGFAISKKYGPRLLKYSGLGKTTVTCVVTGRGAKRLGLITAIGGDSFESPIGARVSGA